MDHVLYHGRALAIVYDRTGTHYGLGAGLRVLVDGRLAASTAELEPLSVNVCV